MSDERFDRIENQIGELRTLVQQGFTVVQQDISEMKQDISGVHQDITGIKQDLTGIKQRFTSLEREVESLRRRIDSVEGTLLVTIRDGFQAQSDYADDLNYDLSINERKTRRLSRRVARLERAGED
jgi:septal ring factor EnvC (AmiA/AmiB activator)